MVLLLDLIDGLFALGHSLRVFLTIFFDIAVDGKQFDVIGKVNQAHAHRGARGRTNLVYFGANDPTGGGNGEDFIVFVNGNGANELAALRGVLEGHHAQATAALRGVFLNGGALTVATGGSNEQELAIVNDGHRQQLVIAHDGENYLTFSSRTWKIDTEGKPQGPSTRETGFWRISAKDEIEVTYTSSTGIVEIFYGEPFNERAWQLESASTMVTETGPKNLGPGKRMYGLMPNNNLGWVDERMVDGEMRPYMSAELTRIAG